MKRVRQIQTLVTEKASEEDAFSFRAKTASSHAVGKNKTQRNMSVLHANQKKQATKEEQQLLSSTALVNTQRGRS